MAYAGGRSLALFGMLASGTFAFVACGTSSFEGGGQSGADGGSDAAAEASLGDGGPSIGDGGRFCTTRSPTPFFCADFDDTDIRYAYVGTTDSIFFGRPSPTFDGGIGLVPDGENGSQALGASLPALSDASAATAILSGTINSIDAAHVTLKTDLKFLTLDDVSGSSHVYLLGLGLSGSAHQTQYDLVLYSGDVHLDIGQDSVSKNSIDLGPPPAPGPAWVPVTIDVDLRGIGTAKVDVTFGSTGSGSSGAYVDIAQQNVTIDYGERSAGNTAAVDVEFDDATLDVVTTDGGIGITPGDAG